MSDSDELSEFEVDYARLRAYFWNVGTRARLLAARQRSEARRGRSLPLGAVTPETLEAFAGAILGSLDRLSVAALPRIRRVDQLLKLTKRD